ncbi:hypothetical protein [Tianweitania sediminis]|jgi:hypothetical protein|uniref:Uncharacterized protein n=1 Tax=Tianweitania sediminis TaxID=1502156 RepID=A0A8J7RMR8_9HYPH|nr:hypothetical protein [Tianweitania sediminis]MBP0441221.1 hypothetical protein [Tianweitania sediminis]HEV7416051.1 hypothetical protein [Tianweitania sediminis]
MNRQDHSEAREIIVATAISEVVTELRMVDVSDYLAFIRFEQFASIADIVESAAELYFMPGTLKLGHGGEALVNWGEVPRIKLDLELRPQGATVYFTLAMEDKKAGVEVNYVSFDKPTPDPQENTRQLAAMIEHARIRKSPPVLQAAE